jgi:iron complex transport system substrate-binding protein
MKRPTALRAAAAAVTLTVLAALTACSSSGSGNADTVTPGTSATVSSGTFPVTVGDITLSQRPTHIVSLSPTATDMLYAIGAGPQVAAVDKNSAAYFTTHQVAGAPRSDLDAYQPNAEAIAGINPDLVVISNDTNKIKEQLNKLKIPVYVGSAATTLDDTYKQETDLGQLTGHVDGAAGAVAKEKSQIQTIAAEAPKRSKPLTYYYELDQTLYSVTSKTFVGSLFTMVGMTNIADPADADGKAGGYPQLSSEAVIKANPDLIFLADTVCCKQSATTVAQRAGWPSISAVANHRVIGLDDSLASQWGTQVPDLLQKIVDADKAVPVN